MRSLYDVAKATMAIAPIAQTAAEKLSAAIDTYGYDNALIQVSNGAATGTPDSYTVACKVQECATSGGSYADISGATATISADGTSAQIRVPGLGTGSRLRYIKVSMTPAFTGGTSPKALIGATVLMAPLDLPATNSSTPA